MEGVFIWIMKRVECASLQSSDEENEGCRQWNSG